MREPAEGTTLRQRYRLRRRLAKGGMGEVWLATDLEVQRDVAVKLLAADLAAEPDMVRLFEHEARQVARLRHPNVVPLLDAGEAAGRPFMVLEYVPGGDLSRLEDTAEQALAALFAQVADALAAAHAAGVVHRDLKPSNVLLDEDGRPRVVDFGISAALEGDGLRMAGGGSAEYASPEQRAGEPPAVTDDAWGLGRLILRALPAQARGPLAELAGRLTAPDAAARPSDLSEVAKTLRELAAGAREASPAPSSAGQSGAEPGPVEAVRVRGLRRPDSLSPLPTARETPRRAWLWIALAGLLGILVAVVFFLPGWVEQNRTAVPPPAPAAREPAADPREAIRQLVEQRRAADDVRQALDALVADLEARSAERWAPARMQVVRQALAEGEEAYGRREYEAAGRAWERAREAAREAVEDIPRALEERLAAGRDALAAGDSAAAAEAFGLAAAIEPASEAARQGLARAATLDQVLAAMAEGARAEQAGRLPEARAAYARAAELDPEWGPAAEAVKRTDASLGDARFVEALTAGYAALERGDYAASRRAFQSAAGMRPGSSEARAGLAEVEAARRAEAVRRLSARAGEAEADERWADAVDAWRGVLEEDGSVATAQDRLVRAQTRADLDARMQDFLTDPFSLTRPEVAESARAALREAEGTAVPRQRLDRQAKELARQLALAARPVQVVLESDGKTEVVIYRVGRLGTFARQELELKPGRYTAVGSRPGYRDVRREFLVRPGQPMPGPVVVVSEEPI
ncbi:MAG: serine/threonine-protein kinase [Gammaproteobacteria bacterium]